MIQTNIERIRANVCEAFEAMICAALDAEVKRLNESLETLHRADPMLYRQLLGHTLMNDILRAVKSEASYRNQGAA